MLFPVTLEIILFFLKKNAIIVDSLFTLVCLSVITEVYILRNVWDQDDLPANHFLIHLPQAAVARIFFWKGMDPNLYT